MEVIDGLGGALVKELLEDGVDFGFEGVQGVLKREGLMVIIGYLLRLLLIF